MPVKKTVAKKTASSKKKTAPKSKPVSTSPEKKIVRSAVGRPRSVFPEKNMDKEFSLLDPEESAKLRIVGMSYAQLAELTGIQINTEAFLIMLELLRGGRDRQEVNNRVRDLLPPTTSSGTVKPVPNLVSGVMKKLEAKGFTIKGDWKMVKPGKGV